MKTLNKTKQQLVKKLVGQGIIDAISDGVSIQDTDFQVLYQNQGARGLMGDCLGEHCYREFESRGRICNNCPMSKSFVDGKVHTAVMNGKSGRRKLTLQVTSSPIRNASGKIIAGIEIVRDVSSRKYYKKKKDLMVKVNSEWEEVFDIIDDAITIHDNDFNIIRANKAAEKMLGTASSKILKKKCYELYHGSTAPPESCPSCLSIQTSHPTVAEMSEPFLDKYIEVKALPLFNKEHQITGLVHVVRNISGRKKLEKERENLIFDLTDALFKVKALSGLLPICASCKKIRDDNGYWKQVDEYIREHSDADFTHGICPECAEREFPSTVHDSPQ
jgi:PAS domain S-box-containing protein